MALVLSLVLGIERQKCGLASADSLWQINTRARDRATRHIEAQRRVIWIEVSAWGKRRGQDFRKRDTEN